MTKTTGHILVVDDNIDILETAKMFLKQQFENVLISPDPNNIPKILENNSIDLILLDMNFSKGKNDGEEGFHWLKKIIKIDKDAIVILITAYGEVDLAVKAMKMGATDFVLKPWKNEKLLGTILSAMQLRKTKLEVGKLRTAQQKITEGINRQFGNFIGQSPAIQRVFELIDKVASTDANVLILGENGTGKELVARALNNKSNRTKETFISVDLGALSETLFESEVFGHVKGAFTDAKETRIGSFELASGGTIFLDEIGNLSLSIQAKLLAVLQNRTIKKVGSNIEVPIDIRLICATNRALYQMLESGEFRQDLLYRINTVEIQLPPLRERVEDIPLLANHFLNIYRKKYHKQKLQFENSTINRLKKYQWPGNVRELQHAVERAVILCNGKSIRPDDFFIQTPKAGKKISGVVTLNEMEKHFILQSLEENQGNVTQTAKVLGITRTALYRRLNKYGI